MTRVLNIQELRAACDRLLTEAESKFGSEIDLDSFPFPLAEYWSLDPKAAYAMSETPEILTGSVTDDLAEVTDLLRRPDGDIHLWHDIDHLSGLLRMLAYMDIPTDRP